jgi:plastocyanin
VMSLAKLNNTFPAAQAAAKAKPAAKNEVNIASFAFMPAKVTAAAGKPLTFVNTDDTPHQVTVTNGPRSNVFLRGQRASITLDKAGEYNYICGLHPSMKGVIEVK